MRVFEIKNNLEQGLPINLPDGRQLILPEKKTKVGIKLTESEVKFFQIQNLYKSNLIKINEIKEGVK